MPVAAGSAEWKPATEWHVSWILNAFAGPKAIYEGLTGKRPWTDPVFVDAIALMKDWFDKGWFGGGTDRYFTNKFADLYSALASGKAAMMFTGSWAFAEIGPYFGENAGGAQWDWAPLPSLNDGVPAAIYPLSVGGSISVNKNSKDAALAVDFLNFLEADPKRQTAALAKVGQLLPPLKVQAADFPADVDPKMKRQYVELSSTSNVGYTTWTFWPPKSDTYIYQEMDKVLTGQVSPSDYCKGLDKVFQEELKAGKRPAVPAPEGA